MVLGLDGTEMVAAGRRTVFAASPLNPAVSAKGPASCMNWQVRELSVSSVPLLLFLRNCNDAAGFECHGPGPGQTWLGLSAGVTMYPMYLLAGVPALVYLVALQGVVVA